MSKYLILSQEGASNGWRERGVFEATSADAAIREVALADEGGVYLAVPERSAKPLHVQIETVQRVHVATAAGETPTPAEEPDA